MRDEFPIFQAHPDWIYLDSAATTQKPRCVIEAIHRFYAEEYATVHRTVYQLSLQASEKYQATRETVRRFLNASSPNEIIFTRGTTEALNLVAQSYGRKFLKPGDEILISEMEHHSNIVPWQLLAQATGARLRWIPMNWEGVLEWEGTITSRTKIISIAHVSNVTGTINPIAEIARAAHAVNAILVVDGAQGAPHLPIDVQKLGCDFYAFSGHKCYGPTGIGILFGKFNLLEQMPPIQGGGDMIEQVFLEGTTFQPPPLRFEAGTPQIASVIALKTALEFLEQHRPQEEDLTSYATERLLSIPSLRILGTAAQKAPLITFHLEGVHPLDLATGLDLHHIAIRSGHLCAQPLLRKLGLSAAARISFGLYNCRADVDAFFHALTEITSKTLQSR